jgi:hypothetical protein
VGKEWEEAREVKKARGKKFHPELLFTTDSTV